MFQRTALNAWKRDSIEIFSVFFAAKNQAAAGPAQRLVGGGGNEIRGRYRARMNSCCHETGDMRHVHEKESASILGDLCDTREIDNSGVRACSGYDHLRLMFSRQSLDFVVVDRLSIFGHTVGDEFVGFA